ncbi:MAG: leucine--tRNA ligase [Candidatus Aenigmarchaeota archaeon]|nr:leucine--tRNA ligase [Candidatus Aenigmarchaeota archaeon]
MAGIEFTALDKKWQAKWEKAKLFEANPSKKKKFFSSMVIPYVNGNWHIGHSYTFTRTDAYARFKRMQQHNTLLAQGFHATGEPILGAIERLKKKDESQISTFKLFGATSRDIENFKKKGPKYVAQFWAEKIEESARAAGFSIDWRRKFTLSLTPGFSRFIEWQYNSLRKKGYVVQGTHPVVWCPKDLSPTGDHDRLEGEGESPQELTLVKFAYNGYVLPTATLRPETLWGVTNIWVNESASYVELSIDGERWIVSKDASPKLKDQMKGATEVGNFDVKELIGKKCIEPLGNREIPIMPSKFVDPDNGTGIVMSVPAHAPYDWIAIKELIDKDELQVYGLGKNDLEPIAVVKTEGFGELPAVELCKKMKIESLSQMKELSEATAQLYKKEFHTGVIKTGSYSGMKVADSKEKLTLDFIDKGIADVMWEVNNVICRCTTKCHVKILENQWFLKYSDEEWKKRVARCLSRMKIYPEEARNNFENTLDWLKDKACARKSGLGTPMPWDREWLIETLSDSTIYMAYYTISHIIEKNKLDDKLTDDVFDFIFLGKGDSKSAGSKAKIKPKILQDMRNEFEYFYPLDMRNSGKDLVQNHLTFFLFHHVALFPENKWPKAISVNGFVNVEGEKMSKSRGNIIPLKDLIKQHGADLVRINITGSSEGIDDADWRVETINGYRNRLDMLFETTQDLNKAKKTSVDNEDLYLQSRLQRHIESATKANEQLMFRSSVQSSLFEAANDLKWYLRRTGDVKKANKKILKNYIESIIKLLAPFTPHVCEEMFHLIRKDFVSTAEWPTADENKIHADAESGEELIKKTLNDIEEVKRIAKMQPKKISLFVAEDWKFRVYQKVLRNKDASINDITKEIMSSGSYVKATVQFIQNLYKRINDLQPVLPRSKQFSLLKEATSFLEKETNCQIAIVDSDNTDNPKAKNSTPNRFGLFME